jgi:hypothetical protein
LHLSRKHRLPRAPAIALLQDAMPRPGLPLVYFNDRCCGSVAELRAALKAWLLTQIGKKRPARSAESADAAHGQLIVPERLAA